MATINPYLQAAASKGDRYARAQIALLRQQQANQAEEDRRAKTASAMEHKQATEDAQTGRLDAKPSSYLSLAERQALDAFNQKQAAAEAAHVRAAAEAAARAEAKTAATEEAKAQKENPWGNWRVIADTYDQQAKDPNASVAQRAAALQKRNEMYSQADALDQQGAIVEHENHPSGWDKFNKEQRADAEKVAKEQQDKRTAYEDAIIAADDGSSSDPNVKTQATAIKAERLQDSLNQRAEFVAKKQQADQAQSQQTEADPAKFDYVGHARAFIQMKPEQRTQYVASLAPWQRELVGNALETNQQVDGALKAADTARNSVTAGDTLREMGKKLGFNFGKKEAPAPEQASTTAPSSSPNWGERFREFLAPSVENASQAVQANVYPEKKYNEFPGTNMGERARMALSGPTDNAAAAVQANVYPQQYRPHPPVVPTATGPQDPTTSGDAMPTGMPNDLPNNSLASRIGQGMADAYNQNFPTTTPAESIEDQQQPSSLVRKKPVFLGPQIDQGIYSAARNALSGN